MFNTLRGMRDTFKSTLCYLVGMRTDLSYLSDPFALRDLLWVLDSHICWVGSLQKDDALALVHRETRLLATKLTQAEEQLLLELTGSFPSLLKQVCRWWRETPEKPSLRQLADLLVAESALQHRLKALWMGLTQEEQYFLSELEKVTEYGVISKNELLPSRIYKNLVEQNQLILRELVKKGLCHRPTNHWKINGQLLARFIAKVKERGRGRIWYDEVTTEYWQGPNKLELTPQQQAALHYFLQYPHQLLTKTNLIVAIWPGEWEEVDEARLYQLIRQLRQKIEPNPTQPVYLIHWHAKPEGGYQFFPEGRTRISQG